MVFAHVAADDDTAFERATPAFAAFAESHGMAASGEGPRALRALISKEHAWVGGPDRFAALVARAADAGVSELILWARFAELPLPALEDCFRRAVAAGSRTSPGCGADRPAAPGPVLTA